MIQALGWAPSRGWLSHAINLAVGSGYILFVLNSNTIEKVVVFPNTTNFLSEGHPKSQLFG
jgi:hypothetical protein